MLCNIVADIGRYFIAIFRQIGKICAFASTGLFHCFCPPFFFREIFRQLISVGFFCLPVVGLTAIFTGMVLALQTYTGFARFAGEGAVATVVVISITRELGPVMAGLMVAARISSSIAAELGSMRVSEQIDALKTFNVNPFKFLIVPRLLACVIAVPFLVLVADIIGVFGGYFVGTTLLNFSSGTYIDQTIANMAAIDVISGLVKAAAFGFAISLLGCYNGFYSSKGARGVGEATTNAVGFACICILILNYLLTAFFFHT